MKLTIDIHEIDRANQLTYRFPNHHSHRRCHVSIAQSSRKSFFSGNKFSLFSILHVKNINSINGYFSLKTTSHKLAISLSCHFIILPFHQLAISSIGHFINLPFHHLAISSTGHFINWPFHQLAILSATNY